MTTPCCDSCAKGTGCAGGSCGTAGASTSGHDHDHAPRSSGSVASSGDARKAAWRALRRSGRPMMQLVPADDASASTGAPDASRGDGLSSPVWGGREVSDLALRFVDDAAREFAPGIAPAARDAVGSVLPDNATLASEDARYAAAVRLVREAWAADESLAGALANMGVARALRIQGFGPLDPAGFDEAFTALWDGWTARARASRTAGTGRVRATGTLAQVNVQASTLGAISAGAGALFQQVAGFITGQRGLDTAEAARRAGVEAQVYQRNVDATRDLNSRITAAFESAAASEALLTTSRLRAQARQVADALGELGAGIGRLGVARGVRAQLAGAAGAGASPAALAQLTAAIDNATRLQTQATDAIVANAPAAPPPGANPPPPPPPGETDAARLERERREREDRERLERERLERERLRGGAGIPDGVKYGALALGAGILAKLAGVF